MTNFEAWKESLKPEDFVKDKESSAFLCGSCECCPLDEVCSKGGHCDTCAGRFLAWAKADKDKWDKFVVSHKDCFNDVNWSYLVELINQIPIKGDER